MNHTEFATGLRAIADWIEAHPEVPIQFRRSLTFGVEDSRENAVLAARALGHCDKRMEDTMFKLARPFGAIELQLLFWRATVCERRVVGTRQIPEHHSPASTEEIVEWDCHPIFGGAAEPVVPVVADNTADDDVPF